MTDQTVPPTTVITPIVLLPELPVGSPAVTPWGHNGLGEIVYLRTYARDLADGSRREHWPETIERVIQGARDIYSRLTPAEEDLLRGHMLALRGTVSGRALWHLGTPLVGSAGMDGLTNCWYATITKPADFRWMMNRLMVGGGVGFSVERANVYKFPKVKGAAIVHERAPDTDFIVPDTREGWAEVVERAIDAHFTGKSFSYSTILIRPAGAPLKRFGGTASGPTALLEGIGEICKLMCARVHKHLRSTDILDIANIIGQIVVAGSSRRSAEIAIGDPDDALFIKAKRWANGAIPAWRQNSNNTLVVDRYEEIADEASFWKNFDGGSEPYGLFNRKLARKMGRTGEPRPDPTVEGVNPCFSADTRILTAEGWRSLAELAGLSPSIIQDRRVRGTIEVDGTESWAVDPRDNGVVRNQAHDVRITARQQQLFRLTTANGRTVRATGNHHFATPDGMVMLRDLKIGDDLLVGLPDPYVADRASHDWTLGYLIGLIASDGYIDERAAGISVWDTAGIIDLEAARIERLVDQVIGAEVEAEPMLAISGGSRPIQMRPHFGRQASSEGGVRKMTLRSRVIGSIMAARDWSKTDLRWLHHESRDFKAGFISGLMYGDGSVQDSKGSRTWRLSQSDQSFLADVQLVLQELGVRSSVLLRKDAGERMLPDGHGGRRLFHTKAMFELIISGRRQTDRAIIVLEVPPHHCDRWDSLGSRYTSSAYRDPDVTRVVSIEVDGIEDVWCLAEDERRTLIAEGLTARRCGEAMLADRESCNLATIWLPNIRSFEEFCEVSRLLYKVQKATALLPHPDPATEAIVHKNLRLGQNVTGILDATDEQRSWLSPGYEALRAFDKEWSAVLGVPESVRLTVVQPGGTLSLLAGVSSGIHASYARYYIRRVRFSASDPLVDICRQRGYPVLPEIGIDGKTDHSRWVVEFPCEAPEGTPLASGMSAIDQLSMMAWAGKVWADQGVSTTISYRIEELPAIREWLAEHYDNEVKSVSFLLYSGHGFALAPLEPMSEDEYHKRMAKVHASVEVDIHGISTIDDTECIGGACPVR